MNMKLEQGQVWQQGDRFYRIVQRERLAVLYKEMQGGVTVHGVHHAATKKDFCRLIKGATLLPPEQARMILPADGDAPAG
jgi:hypothetical protein